MSKYKSQYTGPQIDAGIRPYKVYTALLSQSGANAPVATILENTLGTITFSRIINGYYAASGTAGMFPVGKTFVIFNPALTTGPGIVSYNVFRGDNDIFLYTFKWNLTPDENFTQNDDIMTNSYLEIRVYP